MSLNVSVPYSKHWQKSASFMVEYISGVISLTSFQHLSPCSVHFSYPLLAGCQQFNAIKSSSLWCVHSLWIHNVFKQNSTFCQPKYLLEYLSCFHQKHLNKMMYHHRRGINEAEDLTISSAVCTSYSGSKWNNHERAAKIWILFSWKLW